MAENPTPNGDPLVGGVLNPSNIPIPEYGIPSINYTPPSPNYNLPSPGAKEGFDTDSIFNSLLDTVSNPNNYPKVFTPNTKIQSYDADYTGQNFQRYYNVPDVYKKLGFSPYRNNEQLYNNNMTWWDGWKRSVGQAFNQGSIFFGQHFLWNSFDGNYIKKDKAEQLARSAAIGADTRDTFGAWVNNTTMNSGFTASILASFMAEEIALLGLSYIPGMQGLSFLRTVDNIQDTYKALGTVGKVADATADTVRALKNPNDLRSFYKSTVKSFGKAFTPDLLTTGSDIYKAYKAGHPVMTLANASKTFGSFYRTTREIGATLAESKIEAGVVHEEVKQKLIDEHFAKTGESPSVEQLKRINEYAESAGKETFLWNAPVIYLSNKIVLDKVIRGWLPSRLIRSQLAKGPFGKIKFNQAWRKTKTDPWSVVKTSLKDSFKTIVSPKQWRPKNLTKDFLGGLFLYTKANLAEGSQELYQESIAPALTKYYTDKYSNPLVWGTRDKWGYFKEEAEKMLTSKEGLEIFASGFVMAGLVQVPQQIAFQYIPEKIFALTKREEYSDYKKRGEANLRTVVDALNFITTANPKAYFNPNDENAAVQLNNQADIDMANEIGDRKAFEDVLDDTLFEHVFTLAKNGKLDLVKDELNNMLQLSPEELTEAFGPVEIEQGDGGSYYHDKIRSFLRKIDNIEKKYENNNIINPFDYTKVDMKKDPELWAATLTAQQGFDDAIKLSISANYHYDRAVERMDDIIQTFLKEAPLKNARGTDFTILFSTNFNTQDLKDGGKSADPGTINYEIGLLNDEIKALKELEVKTEATKKALSEKTEKRDLLRDYAIKLQKIIQLQNEKRNYIKNGDTEAAAAVEETLIKLAYPDLYNTYKNYVKYISKLNNVPLFDSELEKSYEKLKDFYELYYERYQLVDAINTLHNPSAFTELAKRLSDIRRAKWEDKQNVLRALYEKFISNILDNSILDELSKGGIFFDPAYIEDFKAGRLDKIIFYSEINKEFYELDELTPEQRKVKEAVIDSVLDKYLKGTTISGRRISGAVKEFGYYTGTREKDKDDDRTYAQLAAMYGFSPTANETIVGAKTLLQKLLDKGDKFLTPQERVLARKLLSVVPDVQQVKFRNTEPKPTQYSKTSGIIIDPRYASGDYTYPGVPSIPFEVMVLRAITSAVVLEAAEKDSVFKEALTKIYKEAVSEYNKTLADKTVPFIGLKSFEDFTSEVMTNPEFQAFLGSVKYTVTGKPETSLMQEFLDTLKNFLMKLFNIDTENSALEEAVYLISKQFGEGVGTAAPAPIIPTAPGSPVTPAKLTYLSHHSSFADLTPIWNELLNKYYETEQKLTDNGSENLNKNWKDMTPNELFVSDGFKDYLFSLAAQKIFEEYNTRNNLIIPTAMGQRRTLVTPEQRDKLKNMRKLISDAKGIPMDQLSEDYNHTDEQINGYSYVQAENLIQNLVPGNKEELEKQQFEKLEQIKLDALKQTVYDEYNNIEKRSELFTWRDKNILLLGKDEFTKLGINADTINNMFDQKMAELPAFESLEINMYYMIDGELYKVTGFEGNNYLLLPAEEVNNEPEERKHKRVNKKDLGKLNIDSADAPVVKTEVSEDDAKRMANSESLSSEEKDDIFDSNPNPDNNGDDIGEPCP